MYRNVFSFEFCEHSGEICFIWSGTVSRTGTSKRALLIRLHHYTPHPQGTIVCRYNWHSAGSLGWPFPMLKYKYIFQIKYTEAILSKSTRKLLWFEITKMVIAV